MEKLIILDFAIGDVDIYPIEYENEPDMDKLLDSLGHNANDCQWMFTEGNVTFHKEVLKSTNDIIHELFTTGQATLEEHLKTQELPSVTIDRINKAIKEYETNRK